MLYSQGLCESYKTICSKYDGQVHFKGGKLPKDKEAVTKQNNIIYWFKCGKTKWDDDYVGESARTFEQQNREHFKAPSPTTEHHNTTGHTTTVDNFKIIGREGQNMTRAIKEAIHNRVNNPALNRNIGKYNLPHIWDRVLLPSQN